MFYLLSGAAAVGKSSVVKKLSEIFKNCDCHDYDEIPVKTGTERRKVNEEWVRKALEAQENGNDFMLSAHSPFGEILACPSAIKLNGIKCCLLDCNDYIRVERYLSRPQYPEWPLGMDTLCWAVFHRMHAVDPQWEKRVIVDEKLPEFGWDRWTSWQKGDKRWNVKIIDTSNNSVEETVGMIHQWILKEKQKTQELIPENMWWK